MLIKLKRDMTQCYLNPSKMDFSRPYHGGYPGEVVISYRKGCRKCFGSGQVEIQSGPYYRNCDACDGKGIVCSCGHKLKTDDLGYTCTVCGMFYKYHNTKLKLCKKD